MQNYHTSKIQEYKDAATLVVSPSGRAVSAGDLIGLYYGRITDEDEPTGAGGDFWRCGEGGEPKVTRPPVEIFYL